MSERRRGRTVQQGSTLSAARKEARAAKTAAEIARKSEEKQAPPQPKAVAAKPAPTERPYRNTAAETKPKRVVRTVSERDGANLLRKIDANSGRDIIVMMRDSKRDPRELADELMMNEDVVIKALNSYGGGKNQIERLLAAIAQAESYLQNDNTRPVTVGVKKQKRQQKLKAEQAEIARRKRNPKPPRQLVIPTVDELVPKRSDADIVLDELKDYLANNLDLRQRVMSAHSDIKAGRILRVDVGPQFDTRVKALISPTSEYHDLLVKAGVAIRRDARKFVTTEALSEPALSIEDGLTPDQKAAFARYDQTQAVARSDANDPEVEERHLKQEASLRAFLAQSDTRTLSEAEELS